MTTTIVNKKFNDYDVYIGRGSIFGNHWSHQEGTLAEFVVGSREEAVLCYEKWLTGEEFVDYKQDLRQQILDSLPLLVGKRLGCYCRPFPCHGDVLKKLAEKSAKQS